MLSWQAIGVGGDVSSLRPEVPGWFCRAGTQPPNTAFLQEGLRLHDNARTAPPRQGGATVGRRVARAGCSRFPELALVIRHVA